MSVWLSNCLYIYLLSMESSLVLWRKPLICLLFRYVLCPFATTEGALVASATRGATACNRAGGISTYSFSQRACRTPYFKTGSIAQAAALADWLTSHISDIQMQGSGASRHTRIVRVEPFIIGRAVHARFIYETGDAAGQNMVTTVTSLACRWLLRQIKKERQDIKILDYWIDGLGSSEKKFSHTLIPPSSTLGYKGVHAQAEVYIPESVLKSVLKVSVVDFDLVGMANGN